MKKALDAIWHHMSIVILYHESTDLTGPGVNISMDGCACKYVYSSIQMLVASYLLSIEIHH